VVRFFDQYLGTFAMREEPLPKDPHRYPAFTHEIQRAMAAETDRFVERVVFTPSGTVHELFTSTETFIDDPLRAFYGWQGRAEPDRPFSIPEAERGGIFLQGALLSTLAQSVKTDALHRGLFIYERLLCQHISPPPGVDIFALSDQLDPPDPLATERERLEYLVETHPGCGHCHATFVSLGLGLETFDAVGVYRRTQNCPTIDPAGVVTLRLDEV
jgi:hypothetical protein